MTPRDQFCLRIEESSARLVLVTAPAGYGKSTAMALFARRLSEQGNRIAWLTAESPENDLARFAQHVWLSLEAALPELGGPVIDASVADAAPEAVTGRRYELLDALALLEEPFALFIDDFEHITSPEVLEFVSSIVSNLNEGQRLILGSRHRTLLPLGRLRVQGRLLELQTQDLRFTQEETRFYVASRLKADLGEANLTLLQESTDGWAVAIQLSTAALMGQVSQAAVLKGPSGTYQGIAEYLAEDVLSRLPENQRVFLVQSSLFDTLCPKMCDAVFERSDSFELIEQTEKGNLFLQLIAAEGPWYRYHPLFRDFLLTHLARLEDADVKLRSWHLRAAKWLDSAGHRLQAIEHALAAGDQEVAAEMMVGAVEEFVRDGQFGIVCRWIEVLPSAVVSRHPQLLVSAAYAMIFLHQYKDATRLANKVESLAPDKFAHDLLVLRVMIGLWSDKLPEAMELACRALPSFHDASPYLIGLLRNTAAMREMALGDYYAAQQHLSAAKHSVEPIAANFGLCVIQCHEGAIDMLQGNAEQASIRFAATLAFLVETGDRFSNATAVAAAYLIEAKYELNELESAELLLTNYLSLIRDQCLPDLLITTYRVAARIHLIRGRQGEALATLNYLQELGDQRGVPRMAAGARQGKLRLALRAGDIAAANHLLLLLSSGEIWENWKGLFPYADDLDDPFTAKIRIAFASGKGAGTIDELEEAVRVADLKNRTRRAVRLRCLLAQALEAARKRAPALELLENTLVSAEPRGLLRVIADDSWLLLPLLSILALRSHRLSKTYIAAVIKAAAEENLPIIARSSANSTGLGSGTEITLSQRELQILRLVAEGASNKELSGKLFVSENTVETHLRRIYSKLSTKNRTQAVSKARNRGLL